MTDSWRLRAGLSVLSGGLVLYELTLTRILSTTLWYNFAFLVVSLALLGFGVAGAFLATSNRLRTVHIGRLALFAAASVPASYALLNAIPFAPFSLAEEPVQAVWGLASLTVAALPFATVGLVIGRIFADNPEDLGPLYAWDLLGAAIGAALVPTLLPLLGGSGTALAGGALVATGAALLPHGRRGDQLVAVGLCLAAVVISIGGDRLLPVRITPNKAYADALREPGPTHVTRWNIVSRLDLFDRRAWRPDVTAVLIDGGTALTIAPRAGSPPFPALIPALSLTPKPRTLVVGAGTGREVSAALAVGAPEVVALEVNPAFEDLLGGELAEWTDNLIDNPRVNWVSDEARSWLERDPSKYDLVLSMHTISNASGAAGALALSESYLFTEEAVTGVLDHLQPGGIWVVSRPEYQLPRLVALAGSALRQRGIDHPRDHMLAYRMDRPGNSGYAFSVCLLVSEVPFSPEQRATFQQRLSQGKQLVPLLVDKAPGRDGELLKSVLEPGADWSALSSQTGRMLVPPTDDRPFFHQLHTWRSVNPRALWSQGTGARLSLEEQPIAQLSLLAVWLAGTVLAAVALGLAGLRTRPRELVGFGAGSLYIGCLGAAFMGVEVAMVQVLTRTLGQPGVSLVVGVGGLLLFSAIGSMLVHRIPPERGTQAIGVCLAACAAAICLFAFLGAWLLDATLAQPLVARIVWSLLCIAGPGICMGTGFPLGMRQLARLQADEASARRMLGFAWGVNGFMSVLGSVVALLLAMAVGLKLTLVAGAAVYVVAAVTGAKALRV